MIRQGAILEARGAWQGTIEQASPDAVGRDLLVERLGRLDDLLAQMQAMAAQSPPSSIDTP